MNKTFLLQQLVSQHIRSEKVLRAMETIPRELFVPEELKEDAYLNTPLPIGHSQTISQPYVVARMTELLITDNMKKVLEIGTGSGYQAAILSQIVDEVYSVERILPLLNEARDRFQQLNLTNIQTLHGDGHLGWPEHAPYDGIIVTAATAVTPLPLLEQLADGGRLLLPLGGPGFMGQRLQLITRQGKTFTEQSFDYVIFVPLLNGRTEE